MGRSERAEGAATVITATVVDRLPLVRLGLAASLQLAEVSTVAFADRLDEGIEAAQRRGCKLLVIGNADRSTPVGLERHARRLGGLRVAVLVGQADRDALLALLEAGVDGVAVRAVGPEGLSDLVRRVLAGERVVDPALMSTLVGGRVAMTGCEAVAEVGALRLGGRASEASGSALDRAGLTSKELQVLARLAQGETNAQIAGALFVSLATVKTHLNHMYAKLGVGTRHDAMSRAVALGLFE